MRTTIDSAGRIVVPKAIRDRLGLRGGEELEVIERDGRIEIAPAPTPIELRGQADDLVGVPRTELPPLSDEVVRQTLERVRR